MEPTQNSSNKPAACSPACNCMQKCNLFLFVVIGLVLFSVAGAGGILLGKYLYGPKETPSQPVVSVPTAVPTVDKTANWKTYKNEVYNFTFLYPEEKYEVVEDNEFDYEKEYNIAPRKSFEDFMGYKPPKFVYAIKILDKTIPSGMKVVDDTVLKVWIFDNSDNLNIDQWYEKYLYYPFQWGKSAEKIKETENPKFSMKIGDKIISKYNYRDSMGKVKDVYFTYNNRMFLVTLRVPFDELVKKEISNEGSLVLSTFKFTQ